MARLPFFTPLADGIVTQLPADGGYRVQVRERELLAYLDIRIRRLRND